jgi:hypothetical protein
MRGPALVSGATSWCRLLVVGSLFAASLGSAQVGQEAPDVGEDPAAAADFAGDFSLDSEQGRNVVRLAVVGTVISGTIDFAGQPGLSLVGHCHGRYAHGSTLTSSALGEFEAQVEGDVLTLAIAFEGERSPPVAFRRARGGAAAQPGAPAAPAPPASEPAPSAAAGDPRLVGTWVHQSLITSGSASLASEDLLILRADGSYSSVTGAAAGGGAGWSYDGGSGGEETERGRWRARDRVLEVQGPDGGWVRVGTYGMTDDGQTMRITYEGGGRRLWSRR